MNENILKAGYSPSLTNHTGALYFALSETGYWVGINFVLNDSYSGDNFKEDYKDARIVNIKTKPKPFAISYDLIKLLGLDEHMYGYNDVLLGCQNFKDVISAAKKIKEFIRMR